MKNKILLIFFCVASFLLILDFGLYYNYFISFRGYYSDVILFWLWLILSFSVIIVFWKRILAKVYLGILGVGLVLTIIPMMIPFFALYLSMTSKGLIMEKNMDNQHRAQIVGYSVMGYPSFEILKKIGIFEKRIVSINNYDFFEIEGEHIKNTSSIDYVEETGCCFVFRFVYLDKISIVVIDKVSGKILDVR